MYTMRNLLIFIAYHTFMALLLKYSIQSGFDHNIGIASGLGISLYLNFIVLLLKNANK